jgi:adenine deaminase
MLRTDARFVGFIKGYGLKAGAVATSMAWDSTCLTAVGANDRDLAFAACRMYDIQGGAAVFRDGVLLAEVETKLAGFQSLAPLPEIADALADVQSALTTLGSPWPRPLLTLNVLTTAAIPFFRITDRGYVRLRTGELVGLFVE